MVKRIFFLMILIVILLGASACFNFQIESDVDFPAGRFAAAQERLSALERHNPDRIGQVHNMHILVYDGSSRELVAGVIPMWLVRLGIEKGERKGENRHREVASRYIDFDWQHVEHLSRLGPGLLVRVEDLGEDTHVLLWLE
jgi:hypothetical protein